MIEYDISNEATQGFTIIFEEKNIEVTLEYMSIINSWVANFDYDGNELLYGVVINSTIPILDTYNKPFDFYINDVNDLGLSPFDLENFKDAFYTFNRIEREELNEIRGYAVE